MDFNVIWQGQNHLVGQTWKIRFKKSDKMNSFIDVLWYDSLSLLTV